jgi:hypothetical protein
MLLALHYVTLHAKMVHENDRKRSGQKAQSLARLGRSIGLASRLVENLLHQGKQALQFERFLDNMDALVKFGVIDD